MKKRIAVFIVFLIVFSMAGTVFAINGAETPVADLLLDLAAPVCGQKTDGGENGENQPSVRIVNEEMAQLSGPAVWVEDYDGEDPEKYTPFEGTFVGDEEYTALLSIEAKEGFYFDRHSRIRVYDEKEGALTDCRMLRRDSDRVVAAITKKAVHDWDAKKTERTAPTCQTDGEARYVCAADSSHTMTEKLVDPKAHEWGSWTVTREVSKAETGLREHTCNLCGTVEEEVIPRDPMPYSKVYEPDTSWPLAATIAWRADETAVTVAHGEVRPATAFVWLDPQLRVRDRDGDLISTNLTSYINATAGTMIPAFYIEDAETAAALEEWLPLNGLQDCFVVSKPENSELVKALANRVHVRGMLDYTDNEDPDRDELLDMVASVNGSHGKVVLLSSKAATRETIRLLQSLGSTVWAQSASDTKTLMTLYTNGVNGILVNDYTAAITAQEFFADEAPSLLRVPLIIGHRGDPSSFVENTLDSVRGAFEEGADSVENDIQLSTDGRLFILHDETVQRFLGITDLDAAGYPVQAETFSLAELREHPFLWSDPEFGISGNNEIPEAYSRSGVLFGSEEQKQYTVPTLEEYIEAFKGTGLIHDTEIKSRNPAIIPIYKEMVDTYDAWDQFFTITFNIPVLDAIYTDYPEISIGALGNGGMTEVNYGHFEELIESKGAEAALEKLYGILDQWNATYNPGIGEGYGFKMVRAGRHRGLTVWPWTYQVNMKENPDSYSEEFARDYMSGLNGLTMDFPWITSDFLVEVISEDVTAESPEDIPRPQGRTQIGDIVELPGAELIPLEKIGHDGNQTLMIWKFRADLRIKGIMYSYYYLYSNPFVYTEKN